MQKLHPHRMSPEWLPSTVHGQVKTGHLKSRKHSGRPQKTATAHITPPAELWSGTVQSHSSLPSDRYWSKWFCRYVETPPETSQSHQKTDQSQGAQELGS